MKLTSFARSPHVARKTVAVAGHVVARRVVHTAANLRAVDTVSPDRAGVVAQRPDPPVRTGTATGQWVARSAVHALALVFAAGAVLPIWATCHVFAINVRIAFV